MGFGKAILKPFQGPHLMTFAEVKYGLGRHVETLTLEDYVNTQKVRCALSC